MIFYYTIYLLMNTMYSFLCGHKGSYVEGTPCTSQKVWWYWRYWSSGNIQVTVDFYKIRKDKSERERQREGDKDNNRPNDILLYNFFNNEHDVLVCMDIEEVTLEELHALHRKFGGVGGIGPLGFSRSLVVKNELKEGIC